MIFDLMTDDEKTVVSLENEYRGIDEKIQQAARRGDESALADLSQRKAELPQLIAGKKSSILRDHIASLRQSVAVSRADVADAEREAHRLTAEFPDKAKALDQEKEQLRIAATQAHWRRDSLAATLREKEGQLRQAEQKLQQMLLDHYAPSGST